MDLVNKNNVKHTEINVKLLQKCAPLALLPNNATMGDLLNLSIHLTENYKICADREGELINIVTMLNKN